MTVYETFLILPSCSTFGTRGLGLENGMPLILILDIIILSLPTTDMLFIWCLCVLTVNRWLVN